ncbi:MAG: T9SS type A sorting domain-containing protein [Saprospiraceae bacterium]
MTQFLLGGLFENNHGTKSKCSGLVLVVLFLLIGTRMIAQSPTNDDPGNAIPLTLGVAVTSVTTSGATDSGLDICENGFNDEDDDIFFTFIAPSSGNITVALANPVGVDQFPALSILSLSGETYSCQDFSNSTTGTFTGLAAGTTYFLQVYSFLESPSAVTFDVMVSETPGAPDNDDCADAVSLSMGVAVSGNLAAATNSGVDPCGNSLANDDVWYSFVATTSSSSVYVNRTGGSNDGLRMGVHGGSCDALVSVSCNTFGGESLYLTGLTIDETYYVQVFSNLTTGESTMAFDIEVVVPPGNDACSTATSLACGGSVTNSYRGATPSAETACVTRGVWYTVVGTGGMMTLAASPSSTNDVAFEVYTGSCGSLTSEFCQDSEIGGVVESYAFISLADEVYYVNVGESSFGDNAAGAFTLSVTCNTLPSISVVSGCNAASPITMSGSGDWLPIILDGALVGKVKDTEALGSTSINLFGNPGALRSSAGIPFADRNITINPTVSPSATIAVRLFFTAAEIDALIAADASVTSITDLQFTKVSGSSCSGTFPGGGVQLPNTATGDFGTDYYVQTSVAAFSEFFLSSSSAPLPIELVSFSAFPSTSSGQASTAITQVEWETATEQNVDYFLVERSSDGSLFEEIGEVAAIGESSTLQSYSFVDEAPLGKDYYRLVAVDLDGSTSMSDVVYVEQVLAEAISVSIYPNPTADVLNIKGAKQGLVQLLDPAGRTVLEKSTQDETVQFQTAVLPKGVYFVRVISGATISTKQVVLK